MVREPISLQGLSTPDAPQADQVVTSPPKLAVQMIKRIQRTEEMQATKKKGKRNMCPTEGFDPMTL